MPKEPRLQAEKLVAKKGRQLRRLEHGMTSRCQAAANCALFAFHQLNDIGNTYVSLHEERPAVGV
jgi:hypothetical protein